MDHGAHSISISVLSLLFLLCIILVFKLTSMIGRWSPVLKGLLLPCLHWRTQRPTSSPQKSLALFCGLNLTPSSLQWAEYESCHLDPGSIWSLWSWTIQCECWDPNTLNHQASSPAPPEAFSASPRFQSTYHSRSQYTKNGSGSILPIKPLQV